jgi:hypothetical protein
VKKLLLIVIAGLTGIVAMAQDKGQQETQPENKKKAEKRERINTLIRLEEEGEVVFQKHSIFGIKIASDGYGLSYEIGKYKTPRLTTLLQFELNEKKHNKEYKLNSSIDLFGNVNQVIVGKLNNFYQLKGGYGHQYRVGGKTNKNGVAVTVIGAGGVAIGFLKPYYVDVQNQQGQRDRKTYPEIIDSGYAEVGATGFTVGWGEVKVKPGLHAKTALRFDYGRFNELVTAIEAGVNADYYFGSVPQMAYVKEKNFFFNAYVTILFGRRKG